MSDYKFDPTKPPDPNDPTDTRNFIVRSEEESTKWWVWLSVAAIYVIPLIVSITINAYLGGALFILIVVSIIRGKDILRWLRSKLNEMNL